MRGSRFFGPVFWILMCVVFASCEKSEIQPLFPKKKLSEIHGDGRVMTLKVKLPLSQDTMGIYDASEILEDDSLNERENGILREMWNNIKYRVYDTAMIFGFSNKIKYSFDYEFPEIDSRYIKSVKVNKIFFALENCPENDVECVDREEKRPVTFKFLEQFFMNLSVVPLGERLNLDGQEYFIEDDDYEDAEDRAFESLAKGFDTLRNERGEIRESAFENFNLAAFNNSRSYQKDGVVAQKLSKIYLLRLKRDLSKEEKVEIVRLFKSPRFQKSIQDFSLIGHNIYLELHSLEAKSEFFSSLSETVGSVNNLGIESFEQCSQLNCANLNTNKSNLVPMLERSSRIRFDTYLNLASVEKRDFRYNGFVELEVKLDLGI